MILVTQQRDRPFPGQELARTELFSLISGSSASVRLLGQRS